MSAALKINEFHAIAAVRDGLGLVDAIRVPVHGRSARQVAFSIEGGTKRISTVAVQAPAVKVQIGDESFWVLVIPEATEVRA